MNHNTYTHTHIHTHTHTHTHSHTHTHTHTHNKKNIVSHLNSVKGLKGPYLALNRALNSLT